VLHLQKLQNFSHIINRYMSDNLSRRRHFPLNQSSFATKYVAAIAIAAMSFTKNQLPTITLTNGCIVNEETFNLRLNFTQLEGFSS